LLFSSFLQIGRVMCLDTLPHVSAIILAGGSGKRMHSPTPKQLLDLLGRPVIAWAIGAFDDSPFIQSVVVVRPAGDSATERVIRQYPFRKIHSIVPGGPERQDSVRAGLEALPESCTYVAVHDGVRPAVTGDLIQRVIEAAFQYGNAIAAVPVSDTLKSVRDGMVAGTLDRANLWQAQTPQVFSRNTLVKAHELAVQQGSCGTDDATLVERVGEDIAVVCGARENVKITTPVDLAVAREILSARLLGGKT